MNKHNKSINLSPRLALIASKVDKGSKVIDIGTDHGYIPIYLMQEGISQKIMASDIKKGPLQKALANIRNNDLEDKIKLILSDGLEKIDTDGFDTIIIAGMGGIQICEILSKDIEKTQNIKKLILQPMTASEVLRKWLKKNEFIIIDEELTYEQRKIYNVIVVVHGKGEIEEDIYYYIGKRLIEKKDPHLACLIDRKIKEQIKIEKGLQNKETMKARLKLEQCRETLEKFKRLKRML
jgi:tRNA (adenine22-N1)-methyltransferase